MLMTIQTVIGVQITIIMIIAKMAMEMMTHCIYFHCNLKQNQPN